MCNRYAIMRAQMEILAFARATRDSLGNLRPMSGVYPDYKAPIVRNHGADREMMMARWGMPKPAVALKGRKVDSGVTNVRNTESSHWRRWLGVENRCVVPFSSFSENEALADGSHPPVWFSLGPDRPLAFFAGITTPQWTSVRKVKEGETTNDLFAFLTTNANNEVGEIHTKAMPVILTTPEEVDLWMTAPWSEAKDLQRPLPDGSLQIIARGANRDPADAEGAV